MNEKINCPICSSEMKVYGQPQLAMQEQMDVSDTFPIKIIAYIYHIYQCDKDGTKVSTVETKDYTRKE